MNVHAGRTSAAGAVLTLAVIGLMLSGCGSSEKHGESVLKEVENGEESAQVSTQSSSTVSTTSTAQAPDGAALYASFCQSCHGSLAASGKRGSDAARIQVAIAANKGGMGYLSTFTAQQVQAIAAALALPATATPAATTTAPASSAPVVTPTPVVTPAPDGAALYAQYCNGCHGSGKRGKSAAAIQSAINSNRGGMGSLSTLTSAQITAISAW